MRFFQYCFLPCDSGFDVFEFLKLVLMFELSEEFKFQLIDAFSEHVDFI